MNKAGYSKPLGKLKNKINVKLVSNKKDYLKQTSKPSLFDHNFVKNINVQLDVKSINVKSINVQIPL